MSNHVTDPVPGETIEVTCDKTEWCSAFVVGEDKYKRMVIQGTLKYYTLNEWAYSRRPPKPKLVPFDATNVPLGSWYRMKETTLIRRMTEAGLEAVFFSNARVSWDGLLRQYEYTLDDPRSSSAVWRPCGVEVGE